MARRWIYIKKPIESLINNPRLTGVSETMLKILVNRGIDTVEKIETFMFANKSNLYDTRLMTDADKASDIIIDSCNNNEHIVILGDYDSDGINSVAIMVSALRNIGADVSYYTNNRFIDGYGLCINSIKEIMRLYPGTKLVITVDNGIMSHEGIDYAKKLGLKVVVTDHHEQGASLPNADAVVDPKRKDCQYPFKGLCGAGVAFKLMLLVYYKLGLNLKFIYDMMDLVALATVSDVVPIVDENRILVKEGLELIRAEKRPVFKLFRDVTGVTEINSHFTIGFIYGPMLNAIGRINGEANRAIEIFLETDKTKIFNEISYLKKLNEERKALTEEQMLIAEKMLKQTTIKEAIVLYNEEFHEGIIGLIAGRIKEKYNRPTIVFTKDKNYLKGSARSIDGFHIKEAFDAIAPLINKYGGHEKAAGLSIDENKLNEFESALINLCNAKLSETDYIKKYYIDAVLDSTKINVEIVDELKELEPFGEGFPKPLFALNNFNADEVRYMGNDGQHIKLSNKDLSIIIWREAEAFKQRGEPSNIVALGYPSINVYKNTVSLQFVVDTDNFKSA